MSGSGAVTRSPLFAFGAIETRAVVSLLFALFKSVLCGTKAGMFSEGICFRLGTN